MSREAKARKQLVEYCRKLHGKGFVPGVDGNISMRLDEASFLITPSGVSKQLVKTRELVRISMSGEVMEKGKRPSIETNMHMAVYNNCDNNLGSHFIFRIFPYQRQSERPNNKQTDYNSPRRIIPFPRRRPFASFSHHFQRHHF